MNGYHSDTMWCDARSAAGQRLHSVRRSIYCWHTRVQNVIIDSKTDNNTLNALMHFLFSPACWAINSLVCTVLSVSRCDRRAMAVFVYTWKHHGREMWVARFEDDLTWTTETQQPRRIFNEQQWRNGWNSWQCISEDRVYRAKEILQNLVAHGARQETHLLDSPLSIAYIYI